MRAVICIRISSVLGEPAPSFTLYREYVTAGPYPHSVVDDGGVKWTLATSLYGDDLLSAGWLDEVVFKAVP